MVEMLPLKSLEGPSADETPGNKLSLIHLNLHVLRNNTIYTETLANE